MKYIKIFFCIVPVVFCLEALADDWESLVPQGVFMTEQEVKQEVRFWKGKVYKGGNETWAEAIEVVRDLSGRALAVHPKNRNGYCWTDSNGNRHCDPPSDYNSVRDNNTGLEYWVKKGVNISSVSLKTDPDKPKGQFKGFSWQKDPDNQTIKENKPVVQVPDCVGKSIDTSRRILAQTGLGWAHPDCPNHATHRVVKRQKPAPGTKLQKGKGKVYLYTRDAK